MKPTVDKLAVELADLKIAERDLLKDLEENRKRQTAIIGSLQVKPDATVPPIGPVRRSAVVKHPKRVASVLRSVRPSVRPATSRAVAATTPTRPSPQSQADQSDADRIRAYINAAPADEVITTEAVAKALDINTSNTSNVLSRMTGKVLERVPGTKRGKFRKINRAA